VTISRSSWAHISLLLITIVWGATFVVVKSALVDASPAMFNLLRMAIAFVLLVAVYHRQLRGLTRRQIAGGAIVGFCLAGGYQFQTSGLLLTTASKSAFITGTVVVLVPILSVIPILRAVGQGRPGWNVAIGAVTAFVGLAFLTTPPGTRWGNFLGSVNPGDWLTLGCALFFALHLMSIGRTSQFTPFHQLAMLQTGFATLFLAVTLPALGRPMLHWTPRLITALLVTGFLATAVAFAIQSWAQSHMPATHAALLFTMEPIFASITSFIVLGERLGWRGGLGSLLVLSGILITELTGPRPVIAPVGDV
jgi:drug/metabolite transporter (DMT)-like permease